MRARHVPAILVLLLLAVLTVTAQQITGTIVGTVTDASGAVIPKATVTVKNTDRNLVVRTLTTHDDGSYVAALLPIGHYQITVEAPNFKTFTQNDVELNVNDRISVNAKLTPGSVQEQVSVEANALQVQTQDATPTGLINGIQVRELSLKSRNYEELVALMPGVTSDTADTLYLGVSSPGGGTNEVAFSMNGSLGAQNNWTVDGADNVDRGGNFTLLNYPSVDAIAEFKVLRGNYNAEYGRGAGGQVNVVTRSGTNKFHGGLYEFFRNDALDANTWLNKNGGVDRTPFRYNDFGWTLGGPIYIPGHYNAERNKTFFFYSEEFRRVIENSSNEAQVATAAERAGDFSADGSFCTDNPSLCHITNISPLAAAYIKDVYSHVPVSTDPTSHLVVLPGRNVFNYRQEIIRVDHIFSPKLSVFGRWINDDIPTIEAGGLFNGNAIPGVAQTSTNSPGKNLMASMTYAFTPTFLNEFSYAWSYGAVLSTNTGQFNFAASPDIVAALHQPFVNTLQRVPSLSFAFATNGTIGGFGPYVDVNRNHGFTDNLTKLFGKHTLKFGFQYNRYQKNENAGGGNAGVFNFSTQDVDTGTDDVNGFAAEWANFLTGNIDSYNQNSIDYPAQIRQHVFEFYGQDEWRAFKNLTISYGARFSAFGSPFDAKHATSFDPRFYDPSKAPTIDDDGNLCLPTTCNSSTVVPNPNYDPLNGMIIGGVNSPYGDQITRTPKYVAPRIGIAWDPMNDGKTAVRAGYGVFIDSTAVNIVENNLFQNPPYVSNVTFHGGTFDQPAPPGSAELNVPVSPGGTFGEWKQPYTQQWSLDIQREFPGNFIVDIGYYGSKGTHLFNWVDINQPLPGQYLTDPRIQTNPNYDPSVGITADNSNLLNLIRPYQGYGAINVYMPIFYSNYHSLQTSFQKRFKGNNLFAMNYTWSKALSNLHFPAEFSVPQNTYDLNSEYGPTRYDRQHVFNVNFVWQIPWLIKQEGFAGHILGGWEFSGIVEISSGPFLTAGTATSEDPGGLGLQGNARPDQIANPNHGAPHTAAEWFNTGAFVDPDPLAGLPGDAKNASILGPGFQRWDLSLFKNFKIRESLGLQFRAEAFNVWNHTNFNSVDTTLGSDTFGQITNAHDPRILQLGLKLNF